MELLGVDPAHRAGGVTLDVHAQPTAADKCAKIAAHPLHHHRQIRRPEAEADLSCLELGQVKEVVDQRSQAAATLVDAAEVAGKLLVRGMAGAGFAQPGVGQDAVQRCPEFMGHVGEKLAFQLVGPLCAVLGGRQVGGLGIHQLGEVVPVPAQFGLNGLARGDVLCCAAVAQEASVAGEERGARDAEPGDANGLRGDAVLEVTEGLSGGHRLQVAAPLGRVFQALGGGEVLSLFAAHDVDHVAVVAVGPHVGGETHLRIGLPEPVRRHGRVVAKALLALAQRFLPGPQGGDVRSDDDHPLKLAAAIVKG